MWTKRQAIREADQAVSEYRGQAASYRAEIESLVAERGQYELEYQGARLDLVSDLLGKELGEQKLQQLGEQWGVSQFAGLYQDLLSRKEKMLGERDGLKTHHVVENRYELLEADSASYLVNVVDAKAKLQQEELTLQDYETTEFQWLYTRKCHELKDESGLGKLWKIITLRAGKEKKFRASVSAKFQKSSLRSIVANYKATLERVDELKQVLSDTERVKAEAIKVVSHFDELGAWEFNFEGIVRDEVQKIFSDHFKELNPDSILARVPAGLRGKAAKIHAVSKKYEYASNLIKYLESEERDRSQRVQSIDRVSKKWRRNPSGRVRGDKSKWLQQIPAMKSEGTRKRLGWSRKMRSSMYHYDDYGSYGSYYHHSSHRSNVTGFLAYDVFNHKALERMPHEGFSKEVIPEIEAFREENTSADWLNDAEVDELYSIDEEFIDAGVAGTLEYELGEIVDEMDIDEGIAALAVADMIELEDEIDAIESIIEEDAVDEAEINDES